MKAELLIEAFRKAQKRIHIVGDLNTGAIIALDMEGRVFSVLNGQVLNRVNLEAIIGYSSADAYLNPGGDGLWPAPEGTTLGYHYATGRWVVPSGIRSARYVVSHVTDFSATITAEIDLINNQGLGIPTIFKREVQIDYGPDSIGVKVGESIRYVGYRTLTTLNCLLAPWTLCQFNSGPGCEVIFPSKDTSDVWDLYEEKSNKERNWEEGLCRAQTNGSKRYQVGIAECVPWIEYHNRKYGLTVRRQAEMPAIDQSYIDISDKDPGRDPDKKGVRYSVYSDAAGFMEIEAVGGCPAVIVPNTEMRIEVYTQFKKTR